MNYLLKGGENEEQLWQRITSSRNLDSLNSYIKKFPNGKHVDEVLSSINQIKEDNDLWAIVKEQDFKEGYVNYVNKYGNGIHIKEAYKKINWFNTQDVTKEQSTNTWRQISRSKKRDDYISFLNSYPNSEYKQFAKQAIDEINYWEEILAENNVSYKPSIEKYKKIQKYASKYPDGLFKDVLDEKYKQYEIEAWNYLSSYSRFDDYLKEFPMGKFAAEAKAKIKCLEGFQISVIKGSSLSNCNVSVIFKKIGKDSYKGGTVPCNIKVAGCELDYDATIKCDCYNGNNRNNVEHIYGDTKGSFLLEKNENFKLEMMGKTLERSSELVFRGTFELRK